MTRRLPFVAIALAAGLGLSACANNDAKESDVVNAMDDAGLETEQAECIGAGFEEEFGDDQDLFNDVAGAETPEELPEGTEDTIDAIFADCGIEATDGSGDGPTVDDDSADEEPTGDAGDGGATETTETSGSGTTTTTAQG